MSDTLAVFVVMNHKGVPVWAFANESNAFDFAGAQDTWFHVVEVPMVQFQPMQLFPVTSLAAPTPVVKTDDVDEMVDDFGFDDLAGLADDFDPA